MRHLRHIALAALAVALCAPSIPSAHGSSRLGQLVPPDTTVDGMTGGEAMGQVWYRYYTLPPRENPGYGNGKPCLRLGRTGNILVGVEFQPVPCTVKQGTTLFVWGITAVCDNASKRIDPPSYGIDRAAQIKCALRYLEDVESVSLIVDGKSVDIHLRRYFICSPQRRLQLRADNPLGYPAGPATLTACGWVAWLKQLPPGQHTVQTVTTFFSTTDTHEDLLDINVVA